MYDNALADLAPGGAGGLGSPPAPAAPPMLGQPPAPSMAAMSPQGIAAMADAEPEEYDVAKDAQFEGLDGILNDHGNREFVKKLKPEQRAMLRKLIHDHERATIAKHRRARGLA